MGNIFSRDTEDTTTHLMGKDRRLICDSWHAFIAEREDYAVILFISLFVKHPEYQQLFKKFRANNLTALKKDPKFRAHASAVGRQITLMVDSLDTPRTLLDIIVKNAELHRRPGGVAPEHFVELGRVIIDVLRANQE
ncbi:globin-like [Dermacentor variabilis]|uniref:globin-like n=1 Tax=Dermacentor variabilis TaxID=34621 RepID=UPI003F5C506A